MGQRIFAAAFATLLIACARAPEADLAAPTYYQDVLPILSQSCMSCHQDGGLGGAVRLGDYDEAASYGLLIAHDVTEGLMPPFYADDSDACPNPWGFAHDPRLSHGAIDTLVDWVEAGTPEGDPESIPELPEPASTRLAGANQHIAQSGGYTTSPIGTTTDEFICISFDPKLTQAGWLEGFGVVPGAPEVVHHVLVGIDRDGASAAAADPTDGTYPCPDGFGVSAEFIGGWIPGAVPTEMPEGASIPVPAGARVVLQVHYHLVQDPVTDGTALDLRWADGEPNHVARFALYGNSSHQSADGTGLHPGPNDRGQAEFRIPAGAANHTELMQLRPFNGLPEPYRIFQIANHMHYVGARMTVWLEHSDGDIDCLLETPNWDFDWQQFYGFDAAAGNAPTIYPGDTLWLECTYDNTLANDGVRHVLNESGLSDPVDVGLGNGSLDEMCLVLIGAVPADS